MRCIFSTPTAGSLYFVWLNLPTKARLEPHMAGLAEEDARLSLEHASPRAGNLYGWEASRRTSGILERDTAPSDRGPDNALVWIDQWTSSVLKAKLRVRSP